MVSLRSTVLAVAAASLAAVAQADYYVEPDSVPLSTRQQWCSSEKYTCPVICEQVGNGGTKTNECDPKTLTYGCVCDNGKAPNVSEYSLTLPYFVCQEWGNQCVEECNGSNSCASACREDHPCGALNPKKYNTTSTATGTNVAKPTASETDDADDAIFSDVGGDSDDDGDDSSSSDKKGAAVALEAGRNWGLAVVLGSMFVGFAML